MFTGPSFVAFSGVFTLGVLFSILGSVKLKLAETLNIDDTKVGSLISAMMFTCLIAVLIVGPLTDTVGYGMVALIGFGLACVSVLVLASARNYTTALIACLVLGIAAMCANTIGNTLGPTVLFEGQNAPRASNLLNVFFGIGAFITPLIIALLLSNMGYKKTVSLIGAILFLPIILVALTMKQLPQPEAGFNVAKTLGLLSNPVVLVGGLALFCYIALESSMAGFVSTYLKSHQFSDEKATSFLSGFWIALMVARLITAIFLTGLDPAVLVPVLALIAALAIGLMIIAPNPATGVFGTLLAGFSFGPVFPTLVGVCFGKTDAINQGTAGSVFGLIFAIGLFGGIFIPPIIGNYTAKTSIRQGLKIALGVSVALMIIGTVLWRFVPNVS
ncbi:MAG TPA: MFS transporter [Candidatus Hydrogenedentes bacterium]|jgi:fucose permease|nr:MAG: putative transporter [Candidatus Hydrogenedentes bacterium ADurb.Bin170]HNZ47918.1 MFS transporter [Candidatus Hydrogenedentota bacterium]HOH42004.1 MFS transporter [Candidatus Hydrogenedentota bacterium]HOM47206.1 MFS transporter [Candidatus Hydrogenedentota bacterium]HPX85267.1 MFS transporter [Candidatus Hydrogenedentota bacterium]